MPFDLTMMSFRILLTAWPIWMSPLAYGGPSCSTKRGRHRVHGRAQPDARHCRTEAFHFDHVNARQRRPLAQRDVGGGEAQIVPESCAVDHFPADRVRTSKQPLGAREVARLQRRAHRGARDALAIEGDVGHPFEREALMLERREIALALCAETEVAPDEQPGSAESPDQHLLDEARGAERGEARLEADHVHALDARGGHQLELVVEPGEPRRRRLGSEELPRVRLESQNAGSEAQLAGLGHDPVDQRTMAAVHAVEVTDG